MAVDGGFLRSLSTKTRRLLLERPAIVTGLIDDWPAFKEWKSPELFAKRYGNHSLLARRVLFGSQQAARLGKDADTSEVSVADLVSRTRSEHIIAIDEPTMSISEDKWLVDMYKDYVVPDMFTSVSQARVLSFGGGHRGVQIMQHGAAWLGLVTGSKLWHVAPPHLPRPADRDCQNNGKVDWDLGKTSRIRTHAATALKT